MHEYVVCFTGPDRVLPNTVQRFLDAADQPFLPFVPGRHRRWQSRNGDVSFAGWEADGAEPHVRVDERGLVAISGLPRPRVGRWPPATPLVDLVADAVHSAADADTLLAGVYTAASLGESRCEVWADRFGTTSLYIGRNADLVAVGNRSALVAGALAAATGRPPRRDLAGSAMVAWAGYKLGRASGFDGVEFVEPGHRVVATGGRVDVVPPPTHLLGAAPGESLSLDDTIEEIVAGLQFAIDRAPDRPVLELTGGKDSRLSLAVAVLAGLHGEFDVLTRGSLDSSDSRIARTLAERAGVPTTAPTLTPRRLDFAARIRAHVERTDGLISAYENSHPDPDRRLTVSSHAGEIMRGAPASDRDPTTLIEACRQFGWMPYGTVPFVRPELTHDFARELEALMLRGTEFSDDPADLRELFEACYRARWLGVRPHAGPPRVISLLTLGGVRYAWAKDRAFRLSEPVHHPAIERAGHGLIDVPLGKGGWNRRRDEVRKLVPFDPDASKSAVPRHWIEQSAVDLGTAVQGLLRDNEDSPAWEVIDRDLAVGHAARFPSLRPGARRQLLGALTAAIWLNGTEAGGREEWVS